MSIGEEQFARVMRLFNQHKLRSSDGEAVRDIDQAKAIAQSEKEAAESRGIEKRTWRGRSRIRPRLKKK